MKKLLCAIMASALLLQLTACGSSSENTISSPVEDSAQETTTAEEVIDPEEQLIEELYEQLNNGIYSVEDIQGMYEAGEISDYVLDCLGINVPELEVSREEEVSGVSLQNQAFLEVMPFSEGRAWVKYMVDDQVVTSVINTKGEIVFTPEHPAVIFSAFRDGYAYYLYSKESEGEDWSNSVVSCIVDQNGNITYTSESDGVKIILAYGDGHFVAVEHVSSFDIDEWRFGSIDKGGNTLVDFATYDNEIIDLGDMKYLDYNDLTQDFEYLEEGIFRFYSGNSAKLYNVRERKVIDEYFLPDYKGIFQDGYMIYSYLGNSWDIYALGIDGESISYDSRSPFDADEVYLSGYSEQLFFYDRAYYTIDGTPQIEFPQFEGKLIAGGRFTQEKAPFYVQGADKKDYFTIIDSSGNALFDPLPGSPAETFSEGYLVVEQENGCALYDAQGNKVLESPYHMLGSIAAPENSYGGWYVTGLSSEVRDGYFIACKEGEYVPTVFIGVDGSCIGQ